MRATHPNQISDLILMALTAGDAKATAALYEVDAVIASDVNNPTRGRDAIEKMIEEFLQREPSFEMHSSEVVKCGEVALVRSEWTIVWTEKDGESVRSKVVPTLVVRRQSDGHWLVAVDRPVDSH